jgi:hypothetical protein
MSWSDSAYTGVAVMEKDYHEIEGEKLESSENSLLLKKIENTYKAYRLSELYLIDVEDDYGKQKIARLRMEFSRHELVELLKTAVLKGIHLSDHEMLRSFYEPSS